MIGTKSPSRKTNFQEKWKTPVIGAKRTLHKAKRSPKCFNDISIDSRSFESLAADKQRELIVSDVELASASCRKSKKYFPKIKETRREKERRMNRQIRRDIKRRLEAREDDSESKEAFPCSQHSEYSCYERLRVSPSDRCASPLLLQGQDAEESAFPKLESDSMFSLDLSASSGDDVFQKNGDNTLVLCFENSLELLRHPLLGGEPRRVEAAASEKQEKLQSRHAMKLPLPHPKLKGLNHLCLLPQYSVIKFYFGHELDSTSLSTVMEALQNRGWATEKFETLYQSIAVPIPTKSKKFKFLHLALTLSILLNHENSFSALCTLVHTSAIKWRKVILYRTGKHRRTLLHAAALSDNPTFAKHLKVRMGSLQPDSKSLRDAHGFSALLLAVGRVCPQGAVVEVLSLVSGMLQAAHPLIGITVLHLLALNRNKAFLLPTIHGASCIVNAKAFSEDRSPLAVACCTDNLEAVKHLLQLGADPVARDGDSNSSLHLAALHGSLESCKHLVELDVPVGPSSVKKLGVLLLNKPGAEGRTPIHLAAVSGWTHTVEFLISAGARPEIGDGKGWPGKLQSQFSNSVTPTGLFSGLLYALHTKSYECITELLKYDLKFSEGLDGCPQMQALGTLVNDPVALPYISKFWSHLATLPDFFDLVNVFLRKRGPLGLLEWLDGPLIFLRRLQGSNGGNHILDLENKLSYARAKINLLAPLKQSSLCLLIDRDDYVLSLFSQLVAFPPGHLRTSLNGLIVRFSCGGRTEEGAGLGPEREFFSGVGKHLMDFGGLQEGPSANYALFDSEMGAILYASVAALSILRKAQCPLPPLLPTVFRACTSPTEYAPSLDELKLWDLELAEGLKKMQETEISEEMEQLFDCTEATKFSYISQLIKEKLLSPTQQTFVTIFRDVLFEIVPAELLRLFDPAEFHILTSGDSDKPIDLEDWKLNTEYVGGGPNLPIISWFWETLALLGEGERRLVLTFCTGTCSPPLGGFSNLRGLGGTITPFKVILENWDDSRLPEARTCFNMLLLPRYTSKKVLHKKLLIAIRMGNQGFAFD